MLRVCIEVCGPLYPMLCTLRVEQEVMYVCVVWCSVVHIERYSVWFGVWSRCTFPMKFVCCFFMGKNHTMLPRCLHSSMCYVVIVYVCERLVSQSNLYNITVAHVISCLFVFVHCLYSIVLLYY